MNLHCVLSKITETEIRMIALASRRIITPRECKPLIGATQDTLVGSYLMTQESTKISWHNAMNMLMKTSKHLSKLEKGKSYNGKELYSLLLPSHMNMLEIDIKDPNFEPNIAEYSGFQPDDIEKAANRNKKIKLSIVQGQITKGEMKKGTIGTVSNNVIHKIWNIYGREATQNFIDDMQRLALKYLEKRGFTMSILATQIPTDTRTKIIQINQKVIQDVEMMLTKYEANPESVDSDIFEGYMTRYLSKPRDDSVLEEITKVIDFNNNIYVTISSGSKGSNTNLTQIIGCLGQNIVEGRRMQLKCNGRTLPSFSRGDMTPKALGYIDRPFVMGIPPEEFYFQIMAGREGLISTAVKTADTGYTQKKMVKIAEDLIEDYRKMVTNADGRIVQYCYGGDNSNPEMLTQVPSNLILYTNQKIIDELAFSQKEILKLSKLGSEYDDNINSKLIKKCINIRDEIRRLQTRFDAFSSVRIYNDFRFPLDLYQTIQNEYVENGKQPIEKCVDPMYVLEQLSVILDINTYSTVAFNKKMLNNNNSFAVKDDKTVKLVMRLLLYDYLSPKRCVIQYGFNKETFDRICTLIIKKIKISRVNPGENVGIIAAQSMGEPLTQMTLSMFHTAGTGKGAMGGGLTRLKEILSMTPNVKMPRTTFYFTDDIKENEKKVNKTLYDLKHTYLSNLADKVDIIYDPNIDSDDSLIKQDNVTDLFGCQLKQAEVTMDDIKTMNWVYRIVLNREAMLLERITIHDIKRQLCVNWDARAKNTKGLKQEVKDIFTKTVQSAIMSNSDSSTTPLLHIRFQLSQYDKKFLIAIEEMLMTGIKLRGVTGINNIEFTQSINYFKYNDDGSYEKRHEYRSVIDGINMEDIRYIHGIDLDRTFCNNIVLVKELYGIEAARELIYQEITRISGQENFVIDHHISLIADAMTFIGDLAAINRFGILKIGSSTYARASFERTVEQFVNAALFGEEDFMQSVSARIMAGMPVKEGTGICDFILDTDKLDSMTDDTVAKAFSYKKGNQRALDKLKKK
jgi:DNA-directed RNA polymerase II subunit RPB1